MKIPKILQNSAIYGSIMVLQKGISFFLLPLYTAYLSPSSYGILSVVTSISSFLAIFITLGLEAAATRFFYAHKGDEEYIKKLYGNVALIVFGNSILVGVIFILCHKWLVNPIIGEIPFYPFVFVGILNVIITPMYLLYQNYLQTIQNGVKYGLNTFSCFIIQVTLTIVSLTVLKLGVLGVLLAQLITSLIFFLYAAISFVRKQNLKLDNAILKPCFKYSLPLLPHILANWSNGTIDRLMINGMRSEAAAGLYSLGEQYGSITLFSANALNQAYVPWFFEKVNEGEQGLKKIIKVANLSVCGLVLIALFLSLFAQEILGIMIVNPAYNKVWMVIPFINFAYIFQLIYFFFVNVLFIKDTKVVFTITIATVGINVGLNILLIPTYGFIGCGIACLLTFFSKSILALVISRHRNKEIRFNWGYMYFIAFIGLIFSLAVFYTNMDSLFERVMLKSAILVICLLTIIIRYRSMLKELYDKYKVYYLRK